MDFKGFLNKKDQKSKDPRNTNADKESVRKGPAVGLQNKGQASSSMFPKGYSEIAQIPSSFMNDETLPSAATEKDLGNEYFKQKKYLEAIDCYSRSIALSPTAVAFANRAMAYLKVRKYAEAESDCTEALNLDDRNVKAYSRRATARKELGKFKASMEDADFAVRLDPNNQEVMKQYTEAKALLEKELAKSKPVASKTSTQGKSKVENSDKRSKGAQGVHSISSNLQMDNSEKVTNRPLIVESDMDSRGKTRDYSVNGSHESVISIPNGSSVQKKQVVDHPKHDVNTSVQDLASRAASRVMNVAVKDLPTPKTAYEFEVSWRALSAYPEKQAHLLKAIPPASLPQIFKNALSSSMLIGIIKCTATFFKEDTELALDILDNLAKVPRFGMIVMSLSAADRSAIRGLWEDISSNSDIRADQMERLDKLRPKYS